MIKLGSKVRDTVTGFRGVAIARTEWIYGCNRIGVEAAELHEGKPIETQWFDEQRVEIIREEKPEISKDNEAASGGPRRDPGPPRSDRGR